MEKKKLLLVDGNSIMFRSFYAMINSRFTAPDGRPTNAIYGFLQTILKIIEEETPNYIGISFDMAAPLKRLEIYKDYKAGRMKMPEDLAEQMVMIKEILKNMNIPIYEKAGDEADDINGTLAKAFSKRGCDVCILTGDRDYFQLIDEKIYIKYPKIANKKTEYISYDVEKIEEEYGVSPESLIEVKGLMGDSSDNIPGIAGVGEKTALKLIKEYESIDGIYEKIEKDEDDIAKGLRKKLIEGKDTAYMSRKLGEIVTDLDIEYDIKDMEYITWKNENVYTALKKLNITSIISKYNLENYSNNNDEEEKYEDIEENITLEELAKKIKEKNNNIKEINFEKYLENNENIIIYNHNESKEKYEKEFLWKVKKAKEVYVSFVYNELKRPNRNSDIKEADLEDKTADIVYNSLNDIFASKDVDYIIKKTKKKLEEDLLKDKENSKESKKNENGKEKESEKILEIKNILKEYMSKNDIKDDIHFGKINDKCNESISNEIIRYINIMLKEGNKAYIYTYKPGEIKDVLENGNIQKISHCSKSHIVYLKEKGIEFKGLKYDTEIAGYILDSSLNNYTIENLFLRIFEKDISKLIGDYIREQNYFETNNKKENKIIMSLKRTIKKILEETSKKEKDNNSINNFYNYSNNENYQIDLDTFLNDNIEENNENKKAEINKESKDKKNNNENKNISIYNIEKELKILYGIDSKNIDEKAKAKNMKEYKKMVDKLEKEIISAVAMQIERIIELEKYEKTKYYLPIIIYILKKSQEESIKENKQERLLEEIEIPLIYVLADMQYKGMFVDEKELSAFGDKLKEKSKKIEEKISEIAGHEINVSSPKQIGELLFEELKIAKGKKTKTGYSTGFDELKKIEKNHEVVGYILEYREINKLISTYVDGLNSCINSVTGNIHSEFKQTVTATGRISSVDPNMQNIPTRTELGQEIRKCFKPQNYVYIDGDYSQIELRVLSAMSKDETMINAFKEGMDIHRATAATVLNKDYDEVTKKERSSAKAVNFGIIYGISDYGLSENLGIPVKEAKEYIEKYLEKYSKISEYMENIVESAKENGYVETLYNRRRYTPGIDSKNYLVRESAKRIAMNAPIQGTAADIMKIAMVNVYNRFKKENIKSNIVLQVHDELIIDTLEEEKEMVFNILKEEMENAADIGVKLIADINEGKNWNESK